MEKINTDGTPDASFGSGGVVRPDFVPNTNEFGRAILLQPNGAIVIAGYTTNDSILVRLTNAGAPDTSFDHTGEAEQFIPHAAISAEAVALEADGSLDIAGTLVPDAGSNEFLISHVPTDYNFSAQGESLGGDSAATAITDLPNGTHLVAGYTNANGTYDFAVARFAASPTGFLSLDPSFGTSGKTIIDAGGSDLARAMVIQPDGKIIVAGTTTAGSGTTVTSKIVVVRLLPTGQPDPAFGTNGTEVVAIAGAKLVGNAVALQSNGDIIVGGTITLAGSNRKQLLAIRLHGDATGTTAPGGGGTTTTGGGGSSGGGNGGVGATIPALKSFTMTPHAFTALSGGGSVITQQSSRRGGKVTFQLNVAATVRYVIEHSVPGRRQRVNGKIRCQAKTHKNAHAALCARAWWRWGASRSQGRPAPTGSASAGA